MSIKQITRELGLKYKKGGCPLRAAGIKHVDFKDVELIKEFLTEKGKITPKRISGLSTRSQKMLTNAIKRARNLALISYSAGYIGFEEKPGQSIYTDGAIIPGAEIPGDTINEDDIAELITEEDLIVEDSEDSDNSENTEKQ